MRNGWTPCHMPHWYLVTSRHHLSRAQKKAACCMFTRIDGCEFLRIVVTRVRRLKSDSCQNLSFQKHFFDTVKRLKKLSNTAGIITTTTWAYVSLVHIVELRKRQLQLCSIWSILAVVFKSLSLSRLGSPRAAPMATFPRCCKLKQIKLAFFLMQSFLNHRNNAKVQILWNPWILEIWSCILSCGENIALFFRVTKATVGIVYQKLKFLGSNIIKNTGISRCSAKVVHQKKRSQFHPLLLHNSNRSCWFDNTRLLPQ